MDGYVFSRLFIPFHCFHSHICTIDELRLHPFAFFPRFGSNVIQLLKSERIIQFNMVKCSRKAIWLCCRIFSNIIGGFCFIFHDCVSALFHIWAFLVLTRTDWCIERHSFPSFYTVIRITISFSLQLLRIWF